MTRPSLPSTGTSPGPVEEAGSPDRPVGEELVGVQIRRTDGRPVVHVRGSLDASGGPLLEAVVDHVTGTDGTPVLVDLSAVEHVDTHGLRPALGRGVAIVSASGPVRRLLHALGTPARRAGIPLPAGRRRRRRPNRAPLR
ncbi:STAS domain-containing protein [Trujillonella humicola]|uniref:STAS domain-containing protein n=1 Tax=Trujillonella humicola TaxID=3383699 RepID=UPI0039065CA7